MMCKGLFSKLPPNIVYRFLYANTGLKSCCWKAPLTAQRRTFHRSPQLHFELNPSQQMYSMEHAFEEPTFRFICEGIDIDYKEEVRRALMEVLPRNPSNFVVRDDLPQSQGSSVQRTVQLLRAIAKKRLLSFAQVNSTPQLFCTFYEVIAMCCTPLALLAADHFTFAAMIALYGSKEMKALLLDHVDSCHIVGAIAHRELIAEGVPLNTEARYNRGENVFVLRGSGKFAVVGAVCADWAIVTATLTLNKDDNMGIHAFAVQLREGGVLKKGVSARPINGENEAMTAAGVGVLHFENVTIPVTSLLLPSEIVDGKLVFAGGAATLTSVQALTRQMRLASGALYVGTLKRSLTNIVRYVAQKWMVGPDGRRNYPVFGVQHVQSPLVKLLCTSYVYMTLWRRVLPAFTKPEAQPADYEDEMKLAGTLYFLTDNLSTLKSFADDFMDVHSSLRSTGTCDVLLTVQMRRDGLDHSSLIREVAFKSVVKNVGTTHWGWWLSSCFQSFAALDRFVKNPFYSPRIADLGRHRIFFSHKHYREKKRLRQSREIERRKGGSEHQWYDWVMFRHEQVVHCGEAYMEMFALEVMMDETQACTDPRARKILRDMGWIFALSRQQDRLDYFLTQQMMSPSKSCILSSHLDNIVTVMAPQCVNLVDAFQVPRALRAPCAAEDMESYWTIPGTDTGIQRGDKVLLFGDRKPFGNTKAEQEKMEESREDFDLFHGLAGKQSFAQEK
ncbi:acyl-CoA oxidase, putative [Trypanosoma equiperdum]|uniref:Acyl-CoA oxidase C-terminal domain-containing protein n=2 Tax=Trypanozoon TaxID=39700 RepID=Q586U0_TRYB2|nr:hypothetical protein, conserved [Trypanosoma brucei brucei TREU927]AAQ15960.1 hypothetical protein, conserved [Trypanosoma brucei brucei TREU927]AAX80147.1 hypothetical protein, conserved [Trypanosoma brucei]SCU65373.1 acyl-CoA oxidase, putative [Trypanosoma equiperdum]